VRLLYHRVKDNENGIRGSVICQQLTPEPWAL
jgi:hypothetical protein